MASMRDIKRRKVSIQSTQQITKAMKLVSTVRLQKAKNRAERSRAYFKAMYKTVSSMLAKSGSVNHPYLVKGDSPKRLVIMISSNRGLAGGFNGNVVKLITKNDATADWKKEDTLIYALGNKGRDALNRYGYKIVADDSPVVEEPLYSDAQKVSEEVLKGLLDGEYSEIYVAYTEFKNTVTQVPQLVKVLPIDDTMDGADEEDAANTANTAAAPMNYEPDEEEALGLIIPKYVTSIIYGALVESSASENGARMQAMDNATSNAEEMIQHLELMYNRARQGSITQELTEIIAGAEAIS